MVGASYLELLHTSIPYEIHWNKPITDTKSNHRLTKTDKIILKIEASDIVMPFQKYSIYSICEIQSNGIITKGI